MTIFNRNDVERLKAEGRWRFAGQLACLLGMEDTYGCHFGVRSDRQRAIYEFNKGWNEADQNAA